MNLPILRGVNYVTDVHELAPVFSLNSSKRSLFCKDKAACVKSEPPQNKTYLVSLKYSAWCTNKYHEVYATKG